MLRSNGENFSLTCGHGRPRFVARSRLMLVGLCGIALALTGFGVAAAGPVRGSVTVTTDGSVIDGWRITGYLHVKADGVRIRNTVVRHAGQYAVRIFEGSVGTIVEDSDVYCLTGRTSGLAFGNYTARRVRLHGCAVGFVHSEAAPARIIESTWNGKAVPSDPPESVSSTTTEPTAATATAPVTGTRTGRADASRVRRTDDSPVWAGATRASFPGAANTGVPAGTTLRQSGSLTLGTDGQVVDGLDIVGCVLVTAANVTIRRSRISCADTYSIRTLNAINLLVEDVEIDGRGVNQAAVCCSDYTLRRLDISNAIDGPRLADNTVVEDSWIHHLRRRAGTHNDTLQTTGATNVRIRRNALDAYHPEAGDPMNACLMIGSTTAPVVANLVFEGNYCNGGNFSIGIRPDLRAGDIEVRGNAFGRDHRYGVVARPHPGVEWEASSNVYLDDLRPVPS